MFRVGRMRTHECRGWTRRELLRAGVLSAVGVNLADVLRVEAADVAGKVPAKSVILLWLWGGPSHLDSFDLKPKAPIEYRGPYSPIASSLPGFDVCELQIGRASCRERV